MTATLHIALTTTGTPVVDRAVASLTRRTPMHQRMAAAVAEKVREHLVTVSRERHATATRLGANQTHFWESAARGVAVGAVDESGGNVALKHPGIARAFRDVEIKPGPGKKFLTIPLVAEAYGRRAADIWQEWGLFIPRRKTGEKGIIASKSPLGLVTPFYLLVKGVTQKQDRTLLPTDDAIRTTAVQAIRDYIAGKVRQQNAGGLA